MGRRVNSRAARPGLCLWVGAGPGCAFNDTVFQGSGSWTQSAPPGKLQAYQVRNQINTPTAGSRSKESRGFREPPHPAQLNCCLSLPWDRGLFSGSQDPRDRTGLLGTQGDADLAEQSVSDSFWTRAGANKPCPRSTPGPRLPRVPEHWRQEMAESFHSTCQL